MLPQGVRKLLTRHTDIFCSGLGSGSCHASLQGVERSSAQQSHPRTTRSRAGTVKLLNHSTLYSSLSSGRALKKLLDPVAVAVHMTLIMIKGPTGRGGFFGFPAVAHLKFNESSSSQNGCQTRPSQRPSQDHICR